MPFMIFLDTVTGAVMSTRLLLGLVLSIVVILLEAFVLYKMGWNTALAEATMGQSNPPAPTLTLRKRFLTCLQDSFLANLASVLVGWFLFQYVLFFNFWSLPFWISAVVITILVETIVLWVVRKRPIRRTAIVTLVMNGASYLMLVMFFGLSYILGT
jgi:hypothetical protein